MRVSCTPASSLDGCGSSRSSRTGELKKVATLPPPLSGGRRRRAGSLVPIVCFCPLGSAAHATTSARHPPVQRLYERSTYSNVNNEAHCYDAVCREIYSLARVTCSLEPGRRTTVHNLTHSTKISTCRQNEHRSRSRSYTRVVIS